MGKKVSIIIPVYNGANYVAEAIDSALQQTYKNKEIIVVNDGSNDDGATKKVVESYGDKVIYYEKENGGVSTALNLGIEKMTGEYFSWLSHDDLYYPNKLERQMEEIEKYDENTILYSDFDLIDLNGKVFSTVRFDHESLMKKKDYAVLRGNISGITLLIPKKAFDEYGKFDEKLRCVQDYIKWFEFLDKYKFVHIPEVLGASRVHPKQVTVTSPKMTKEGNWLWTYMTENYPKKKMVECEGSEYLFYKEMENYLKSSPYKEAVEAVHNMAETCLEEGRKKKKEEPITVVVIDSKEKEDLEATIESIKNQTEKQVEIIIEGKTKVGKYPNTKNREESLKAIKTEYYTFINAGVIAKENWLEKGTLLATVMNKSVIIFNDSRPLRTGTSNNWCSFLVPIDGVLFHSKNKKKFDNPYIYLLEIAKEKGSFVSNELLLEKVEEHYDMKEVFDYQRKVMELGESTSYQYATLNYDISVLYNHHTNDGHRVYMYEDSDEYRELKFSRTFNLYKKYYDYKQNKKKRL